MRVFFELAKYSTYKLKVKYNAQNDFIPYDI